MIAIKMSSGPIFRDVDTPTMHMWGESEREIIASHRRYHLNMLSFLDNLELNGPADQILPSKPKVSINALLGIALHKYLLQNMSIDFDRESGYARDGIDTSIEQIKPHLVLWFPEG